MLTQPREPLHLLGMGPALHLQQPAMGTAHRLSNPRIHQVDTLSRPALFALQRQADAVIACLRKIQQRHAVTAT